MKRALITGGTRGFGRALLNHLHEREWTVVFDARNPADVRKAIAEIHHETLGGHAIGIAGDITDPDHRRDLVAALDGQPLDLLVNNASSLGPTPLPPLTSVSESALSDVLATNAIAPIALIGETLSLLEAANGLVVNVSSDASVNAFEGWGAYGASKAALDHASLVIGAETPGIRVYAFDPGDMRTAMHQAAFPDEDISDRPDPESVVPRLMQLLESRPPSGRYTSDQFARSALR